MTSVPHGTETRGAIFSVNPPEIGKEFDLVHKMRYSANLPMEWIEMIAQGDASVAADIQKKYVHTLGNLTITGFNSNLSNRPFLEKRDLKNSDGKYIGYKNGLNLNTDLCEINEWNADTIRKRTEKLIEMILKSFSF